MNMKVSGVPDLLALLRNNQVPKPEKLLLELIDEQLENSLGKFDESNTDFLKPILYLEQLYLLAEEERELVKFNQEGVQSDSH